MTLVPLEVKLARYHAAKKKHAALRRRKSAKRRAKARLKKVFAQARAAMGYKPLLGGVHRRGAKLLPEHVAALHAGRDRYNQEQREKKLRTQGSK